MKPNAIALNKHGKIVALEAPEKSHYIIDDDGLERYKETLKTAIENGVEFKHTEITAMAMGLHDGELEQGKLYPVPDGYEIKIKKDYIELEEYAILVPKQESKCKEYCNCAREAIKSGANRDWVDGIQDNCPLKPKQEPVNAFEYIEFMKKQYKQPTSIEEAAENYAEGLSLKSNVVADFIAGAKSDAAKEYWFEIFKQEKK